ncbi:MAG: histidine kinase, partial [Bacteroidetes bacterium]|nr:histidine kinase [Bacteroidota bacterium]
LADLAPPAVANAKREAADLQALIDAEGGDFTLAAWDWAYYTEKVRRDRYDFDESQLRPYFEMHNVLQKGVFFAATKLYGLSFEERTDLPVYHPDVRVFEVHEENGELLGLFIAGPLVFRTKKSRFEFILIAVSSLWIVGNLLRLLLVELLGPPETDSSYDIVFQILTLVGLLGWIGFPVLLLEKVIAEAKLAGKGPLGKIHYVAYAVPIILVPPVMYTVLFGHLGPITIEDMLIPILFYASCYIAGAAFLVFVSYLGKDDETQHILGEWGRSGAAIILSIAILVSFAVLGFIPIFLSVSDMTAGWIIVGAQLLAVAPVTLFSLGTLRHGKVDEILTRAFVSVFVLGLIFFAFVGGLSVMESALSRTGTSRVVIEGLYVVLLLVLFERIARRLRLFASSFFSSERYKARKQLSRFQAEMADLLEADLLAQRTVEIIGIVFKARSAIVFLPSTTGKDEWVTGRFHPEPPYFTEQVFNLVWPHFRKTPSIWARNPELNENTVPPELADVLQEHQAALVVPIYAESEARGLIVFGRKTRRRAVYNLEDLEQMRTLGNQLALAVERLKLVERERQLAKATSSAHLRALRAQINPHFLFNTLNTILSLIEERPEEAEAVVEHLASIFRYTLQAGDKAFVGMEDEFALVDHYLRIESARFGDRLTVDCTMDPSLAGHPVPALAVQTIVENAIKHGLEKRRDK